MSFKKLDLKLREAWAFWDTHGGRILGTLGTLYAFAGGILVALLNTNSKVSAAIIAGGGAFGWAIHGRSANNVAIVEAAKAAPPP